MVRTLSVTDGQTDGRSPLLLYPPIFFEKAGDKKRHWPK